MKKVIGAIGVIKKNSIPPYLEEQIPGFMPGDIFALISLDLFFSHIMRYTQR